MICPKCGSDNVLAQRHEGRGYRGRYYRGLAMILCHLEYLMDEQIYREDGAACECMNCGYKWRPKQEERRKRYRAYVSKLLRGYSSMNYPGIDGAVLNVDSGRVMIRLSEKKGCIIPFDELAVIDHRESMYPFYGRLSIRDRAHSKRAFPKTLKRAKKDRFTILYDSNYLANYKELSAALQAIVEENRKAGLIW